MNQPTTHHQPSEPTPPRQPKAAKTSGESHPSLTSELESTRQQLHAVVQQNQQLVQQNQQLRVEIERIMASALNLHHIVYAQPPIGADESSTPDRLDTKAAGIAASNPNAARSKAASSQATQATAANLKAADGDISSTAEAAKATPDQADASEDGTYDMFAELDRLLAEDTEPLHRKDDESLKEALSHVDSRRRANATSPERPPTRPTKPQGGLRRTVAVPTRPEASPSVPSQRPSLGLILAVVAVMVGCFGAGFFITLPLLQSSND